MKNYKTLFGSSIAVFLGLIVRIILVMLFELLAARYLGPEEYGIYSFVFTIAIVLSALPTLGLVQSSRRFIALYYNQQKQGYAKGVVRLCNAWSIGAGVFIVGLCFLFADMAREYLNADEKTLSLLLLMVFIVPFFAHRRLAISIFSGFKQTANKVMLEDFAEPIVRILAVSALIFVGGTLTDFTLFTLVGYSLLGGLSVFLVWRTTVSAIAKDTNTSLEWKVFLGFSSTMVITELVELILTWMDIIMLGMFSSDAQIGFFRSALQPAMLASVILTSFSFIYMPLATEFYGEKKQDEWKDLNNLISIWSMSLAFPVSIVCIFYPGAVIEILFGEQFLPAVEVLRVLAISYIFHSSCGFTGLNLIIGDKSKTQMVGKVLSLILHAVLNMFLIPELGALGAAWAVLISVIFSNLYNLYWVNRYFSFHPFDKRYTGLLFLNLGIAFLSFVTLEALSLPGFVCILLMAGVHLPLLALLSLKMGLVERSSLLVFVDWVKQVRKSKS